VAPDGPAIALGDVRQAGGKVVHCWALEGDLDPEGASSNTFEMEWPPRSGKIQRFPEVDRASFFPVEEAKRKINPAQIVFLDRLIEKRGSREAGEV
jgi:predicted NUDIX family NTP pyrophosphohydrolase